MPENLGRWVVRWNGSYAGGFDTSREAHAAFRSLSDREARDLQFNELTIDDDPSKQYLYVPLNEPFVYYAMSERTNAIKIGTSKQVSYRIAELSCGWHHGKFRLLAVERGSYKYETERHEQFAEYWITPMRRGESRECFEPGPALINLVNRLLARPPRFFARDEVPASGQRLVLDREIAAPEFRPRLDARVSQSVLDNLDKVAEQQDRTVDEIVEPLLVQHVPQAAPDPAPEPRRAESSAALAKRLAGMARARQAAELAGSQVEALP